MFDTVTEVVVSPPFLFLPSVKTTLRSDFQVAAQNCWVKKGGAFTGEISAEMLANLRIPWVIIGHSERRALFDESNDVIYIYIYTHTYTFVYIRSPSLHADLLLYIFVHLVTAFHFHPVCWRQDCLRSFPRSEGNRLCWRVS